MKLSPDPLVAASWDAEYRAGRYLGEEPVPFVDDILALARERGISKGLYVGCGNGRNFVPLSEAGLDLMGVDISSAAIRQLASRSPQYRGRVLIGDVDSLSPGSLFPLVIGIQVFQHGDRATCHTNIARAQARLERGGLFCLRVNAVGSLLEHGTEPVESHADGSETVRYLAGPKRGLLVHFFSDRELETLFAAPFRVVLSLRRTVETRAPPRTGHWDQWEAIWLKT